MIPLRHSARANHSSLVWHLALLLSHLAASAYASTPGGNGASAKSSSSSSSSSNTSRIAVPMSTSYLYSSACRSTVPRFAHRFSKRYVVSWPDSRTARSCRKYSSSSGSFSTPALYFSLNSSTEIPCFAAYGSRMCVKCVASVSGGIPMPSGRKRERPVLGSMRGSATQTVWYSLMAA